MSIELITGLPGAGKTLLMMRKLREDAKEAKRPLFVCGVDGIVPGLAHHLANARDWNAVDPTRDGKCTCGNPPRAPHAHIIPDGSKIFVDEAWKYFGHLHNATHQATPPGVLELAEHRHRGVDFVWTGQSPVQFYPFARALIDDHSHVVRIFGTHNARVYRWNELNDDVKSRQRREDATASTMRYDRSLFDMYQSATLHTMQRRVPWRIILIPLGVILALALGYLAWQALRPSHFAATLAPHSRKEAGADASAAAPPSSEGEGERKHVLTAKEYEVAFTPRFAAKPWSAPIYDKRQVTADPLLLCVISGQGKDSTCHCYTEQATPYYEKLTGQQCRLFAHDGVYDPYRQPSQVSQSQPGQQADMPPQAATVPGVIKSSGKFAEVVHYGEIHTEQAAPDTTYHGTHVKAGAQ